jgi:drug/metabolite transporter, DME family
MVMTHGSTLPVGRGLWFVCIAATAWGTGGAVAAVLYDMSGLGPVAVSWWRFAGGFALLAAGRRWFGPDRGRQRALRSGARGQAAPAGNRHGTALRLRTVWRPAAVTGCGLAVSQTSYFVAVDLTGLAVATIVTIGAGPVLVAVGARVARIEKPDGRRLAAALVAILGLWLLVGGGVTGAGPSGGAHVRFAGVGFALLAAAAYAAVTLLGRRGTGLPRYDSALAGFGAGALLLAPLAWVAGPVPADRGLPVTLGLLLYLIVVPTAVAYVLFFAGLAVVRATSASVVALVEPVTAAVLGVGLFGERLSGPAVLGGVLLMGTVLLLVHAERRSGRRTGGLPCRSAARRV